MANKLRIDLRKASLLWLGWLHCALIVAICCMSLFSCLHLRDVYQQFTVHFPSLAAMTPLAAFLRGLLFCVPVALSRLAIEKTPRLWQFLACAVLICGLAWLLLGHPIGAVLAGLGCIFRLRKRLAEETDDSVMDVPQYGGLAVFAVVFLISAVMDDSQLQKLAVLSAAVYFLICLTYQGLVRIFGYLELNRSMHDLPARRIQRTAGVALLAAVVLSAALLLPAALSVPGTFHLESPTAPAASPSQQIEVPVQQEGPSIAQQLEELGVAGPPVEIPPIVNYLLYAVAVAILAVGVFSLVYNIIRNFRFSFRDEQDEVRFLSQEDRDEAQRPEKERESRPVLWDRSPNAQVRRIYRKTVLRQAKEPPRRWQSPTEIEKGAGLRTPRLHSLYERARYGDVPCTQEDVRAAKEKA